jgi:hypothetical protein
MTTRTHANLRTAVVTALQVTEQKPAPGEVSAEQILSFRRELKPFDVPGLGRVHAYEPVNVAERDAYHKHLRFDGNGLTTSMGGIVDGIIARVRDKAGRLLFKEGDRARLLELPAETALAIWNTLGGDSADQLSEDMVGVAEKK